jgi:CBS domain-containing protein
MRHQQHRLVDPLRSSCYNPLAMLPIRLLMNRDVKSIAPDTTLVDAARRMRDEHIGSLLVRRGEDYVGILSESDLVRRGMAEGGNLSATPVESVMTRPIITIDIKQTADDANALMSEKAIRHLAVTENNRIIGILSVRDLLIYFKNRF